MRDNRGITLITLIVTIIVMIILAAIGIRVGTESIDTTAEARITNEKKEIETVALERGANYLVNDSAYPLVGSEVLLSEIADISELDSNDIDYIRKVNRADLQSLGVKNTTGNSYIVDYLTGIVYGPVK
ncbi:MAG: type II secretion system protein [Clostridia bacterium]|nr:type II secretion system protein [Clostridia bacterium]